MPKAEAAGDVPMNLLGAGNQNNVRMDETDRGTHPGDFRCDDVLTAGVTTAVGENHMSTKLAVWRCFHRICHRTTFNRAASSVSTISTTCKYTKVNQLIMKRFGKFAHKSQQEITIKFFRGSRHSRGTLI